MKTVTLNIPDHRDFAAGMRQTTRSARTKLASWIAPKPPKAKKKAKRKVAK